MFIAVFVAFYLLGIRQHMGMGAMLTPYGARLWLYREHIVDYWCRWRVSTLFSKPAGWQIRWRIFSRTCTCIRSLLARLVALVLHMPLGSATVAMMGATAMVAPMLPLCERKPGIITIAIGSGARWLHDRDRFALLAGQAILRRDPE